jgi:hypothetical protein
MSPPRDDIETTSPTPGSHCPVCANRFERVRRQRFCSPACRQAAWRARTQDPLTAAADVSVAAPRAGRRDRTVYTCPECEQRYLGEQWCHDCNRPCTRTGIGAPCPACEHPVVIDDLLAQHQDQTTQRHKIR